MPTAYPRNAESPVDVAIVGGGLAGAALARRLANAADTRVAWIAPAMKAPAEGALDSRIYAISPGNAAFLTRLGAWQQMDPARRAPVRRMCIHGDAPSGTLEFDAYRSGESELAWIAEDRQLMAGLQRTLELQEGTQRRGTQRSLERVAGTLRRLSIADDVAVLELEDGRVVHARLVVGADGANSEVRAQAGIAATAQPYGQSAVVANFSCSRPQPEVAWQWFQGGPILALLPLPDGRVSLVWSTATEEAGRLAGLSATALADEVTKASGRVLGELTLVTSARQFPLRRLSAARLIAPRIALVGDAAHVVHPLAGQGANLGLQDARDLGEVIAGREPGRDCGDPRLLRRYERARAEPVFAMQSTVHGLHRLFGASAAGAGMLRNSGLALADRLPLLKNLLIRHAMQ